MKTTAATAILCALSVAAGTGSAAIIEGPSPYLSFADSPFDGLAFDEFYFEDWEDDLFNVPGVTATGLDLKLSAAYAGCIDSVDGDDGVIDGLGLSGQALWANGDVGVTFTFDANSLGWLPTHAGIVWTDGVNDILFEAFDAAGNLIGSATGSHASQGFVGYTDEDAFYGVYNPGGVSSIRLASGLGTLNGIEMDHLQYGRQSSSVPDAGSTLALFGLGLLGMSVGLYRRCPACSRPSKTAV